MIQPDIDDVKRVVDLDNPEQLAEAAAVGAVDAVEVTAARLARLGQAHLELRDQLNMQRAVNENLVAQLAGQLPPQHDGANRLIAIAVAISPNPHDVVGLLLAASVNACLLTRAPRGALRAALQIFQAAITDLETTISDLQEDEPS